MHECNPTPTSNIRSATPGHVVAGLTLTVLLAVAPSFGASARDDAVCADELEALCGDIEDPRDRHRCARDNRERLSDECRTSLDERRRQHGGGGDPRRACFADAQTLCADLVGQGSREAVGACLTEQIDEVSDACRTALENRGEDGGRRDDCRDEVTRLCPDPGDRTQLRECLRENRDQLSEPCRDRMRGRHAGRF